LCTPPESPVCKFILAVAGNVQPLENVLNELGDITGVNALGQGAEQVTNGQLGRGLLTLGMAALENSPEGRGAKGIIFSGKKVTGALSEALGIARRDLGKRIEKIKKAGGLGGADNVNIDAAGNVLDKRNDEIIGNVYDELKEK
jgi:hypothetical protein